MEISNKIKILFLISAEPELITLEEREFIKKIFWSKKLSVHDCAFVFDKKDKRELSEIVNTEKPNCIISLGSKRLKGVNKEIAQAGKDNSCFTIKDTLVISSVHISNLLIDEHEKRKIWNTIKQLVF